MTVTILPNDTNSPVGKLADAELHFADGPLAGLRLVGFAVWERRGGGGLNVTFPARTYSVNGERRSFALLRPITDPGAHDAVRDLIIAAWASWSQAEARAAVESLSVPVEQALQDRATRRRKPVAK